MPVQPDPASKFNLKNLRANGELKTGEHAPATRGVGWKGALHGLTRIRRPVEYKNLSREDVAKGAAVLEEKLKGKNNYGRGLNRRDINDLNQSYEKMRRAGDLSSADVKDFKRISSQLKEDPTPHDGKPPTKPTAWW